MDSRCWARYADSLNDQRQCTMSGNCCASCSDYFILQAFVFHGTGTSSCNYKSMYRYRVTLPLFSEYFSLNLTLRRRHVMAYVEPEGMISRCSGSALHRCIGRRHRLAVACRDVRRCRRRIFCSNTGHHSKAGMNNEWR